MHALAWNYLALLVAVAVIVWFVLSTLYERASREREAYARAVPAVARVLKVGRTTVSRSYGGMVVELLIQVHRPGLEAYELSTIWTMSPSSLPKVHVGQTFAIKIDPQQPGKIYSGETWAHSLGVMKTPIDKWGG